MGRFGHVRLARNRLLDWGRIMSVVGNYRRFMRGQRIAHLYAEIARAKRNKKRRSHLKAELDYLDA